VRISTDGDPDEKRYSAAFCTDRFPSYERFWVSHVVPLTRRDRNDIHFRSRVELGAEADEDVAMAQLHYTTLRHLGRVWDLLNAPRPAVSHELYARPGPGSAVVDVDRSVSSSVAFTMTGAQPFGTSRGCDLDWFTEAFVRLAAASDVADELLKRRATPGKYLPWNEKDGERARRDWRKVQGDDLQPIRDYRNRLVHGRIVPCFVEGGTRFKYPRIEKIDQYLDWRDAEAQAPSSTDFARGDVIVAEAWEQTVSYVEENWRVHLLR